MVKKKMGTLGCWSRCLSRRTGCLAWCRPGSGTQEAVRFSSILGASYAADDAYSNTRSKVPHSYLSTTGAFNGSGIALASQSFESGGFGSVVMYFQHHTGQIRSAQLDNNGEWRGGDATEVVATDAKNRTPIAAVAYARNETARVRYPLLQGSGLQHQIADKRSGTSSISMSTTPSPK